MKEETTRARWIAAMAATAIALYLCWLMLKPFVVVLEWATVLVIVFYPVHKRLAEKIRRPGLSSLVSCLLVIVVVLLPLTFLIATLATELAESAQNFQQVVPFLDSQSPRTARFIAWLQQHVNFSPEQSQQIL